MGRLTCSAALLGIAAAACGGEGVSGPCAGIECAGHGVCFSVGDAAYCECATGYHPENLDCVANDASNACRGVSCDLHGTCRAEVTVPVCDCDPGYVNLTDVHCILSNTSDGGAPCDDRDPCTIDRIGAGGSCAHDPVADGTACGEGLCCAGACIDPRSDASHCGSCSVACPTGQFCGQGTCCAAQWSKAFPDVSFWDIAVADAGTIVACGVEGPEYMMVRDENRAFLVELDACGNELRRQAFVPTGLTYATAYGVEIAGGFVYVAGEGGESVTPGLERDGFFARLSRSTLAFEQSTTIGYSTERDGLSDLVRAAENSIWAAGYVSGDTAGTAWPVVAKSDGRSAACGWYPFTSDFMGHASGVAASGDRSRVFVAGSLGDQAFLTSYAVDACAAVSPCNCGQGAPFVRFLPRGLTSALVSDVAADGSAAIVSGTGWITGSGDLAGFLARIEGDEVVDTAIWSPTTDSQQFNALAVDPERRAVFTTADTVAGLSADAVIVKYDLDGLDLDWVSTPLANVAQCWGLAVDLAGGIIVGCMDPDAGGTVRRCLPDGTCP